MVFFIVGRKSHVTLVAAALAILLLLAGAAACVSRSYSMPAQAGGRQVPIYCVARDDRAIAVTVDATWGADRTVELLNLFDDEGIKVTFFLAGHWITEYPLMVKEIAARGHELGNHSWTHPNMGSLSEQRIIEELDRTQIAIEQLTSSRPKVFRPPFGDYSNRLITVAFQCGLNTIQWSVDSLDWKNLTADQIVDRVVTRVKPGAIILFHNAALHTPEALARIIPSLRQSGYTMVTVSDLLLQGQTYVDKNTGEQRRVEVHGSGQREQPQLQGCSDDEQLGMRWGVPRCFL